MAYPASMIRRAIRLSDRGLSARQIAARLEGPCSDTVYLWLKHAGRITNPTTRKNTRRDQAVRLWGEGFTVNEIATRIGVTPTSINRYLQGTPGYGRPNPRRNRRVASTA